MEITGPVTLRITKFVFNSKNYTMNIIITGTSRGIGYETVKILTADKENNIYAISRNQEGLDNLKNECQTRNNFQNLQIFPFDLVRGDYNELVKSLMQSGLPNVDILINNAGTLIHKPFESMEDKDFDAIFDTNVKSIFKLIKYLMPYFPENAHIVNIGSMGGVNGSAKFPGLSLYSASKGAVAILTECLAEEFKNKSIKVNCLALGSAQTEMLSEAFPGYRSPLTAAEMAAFIADFSLKGHRWFNGKIIPVAVSVP